ncbi:TPA: DUF262 domain-containing protein [Klebsiella quasipneumoniae]|uniref:DUF262 domain-containing protein n=1 Tax=Klebsiella quasipneumoniae TaxID=1463165 RepID=UPI0019396126|nr:DUF262 domain-containing protein [Klebsiella quasipneumoniae]HBT0543239.1 DUF262 domain-containing protein [Klebsiella pneumoniae]MBM0926947.1 DUF262 domain-containing protein [Klebsiella quasipneumoniae]MCU8814720.1 DUF262 domain-containing protein [Klebsiella quasipneumoniae]HBT5872159.1 DUF262 domain-containing protein [Klebsiella quasipneumoniae]HBT5984305.1 DUF262 domain-containing protein [Klebsiella quasipneumoniae]
MGFVVIRLGRDSTDIIETIDLSPTKVQLPFEFAFICKQVEESIVDSINNGQNIYCFIYLGSNNNKGLATPWKQGLRAIGKVKNISGRVDFQSECTLLIDIISIFPKSIDRKDFLKESPDLYFDFSDYPIIGLSSSRNNSLQRVHESDTQDTSSLLTAISYIYPDFRLDLSLYAPELLNNINYVGSEPEGYEKESIEITRSLGWGNEYPLNTVLVRTEQRTIIDVVKRIEKGRYKLDPDFQRDFVWPLDKQSKLIESCLMRIPLPVFYVAEAKDGGIIVVDGLQRLTTFYRYLTDQFSLTAVGDPDSESSIHGAKFSELPIKLQERIEDTQLTLYILDEKAPERAKLDIFDRVNGGMSITRQQMRNCLFNGPGTHFLAEMAKNEVFLRATGSGLDSKTMRDREVINRFCAFYLLGFESYRGDMDDYLAKALDLMNSFSQNQLYKLEKEFINSMNNNFLLFSIHAFRKSLSSIEFNPSRSVINVSLFDVFSVLFANINKNILIDKKNEIVEAASTLLNDYNFNDSISISTNSRKKVFNRFLLAKKTLMEVL